MSASDDEVIVSDEGADIRVWPARLGNRLCVRVGQAGAIAIIWLTPAQADSLILMLAAARVQLNTQRPS